MSELTFGVEIECGVNREQFIARGWQMGSHGSGSELYDTPRSSVNQRHWRAERDGSLDFRDKLAVEFVSPILRGAEGVASVRTMCGLLREMGARVNKSCGLHVHVGVPTITEAQISRIAALVSRFEMGLYASTGTWERQHNDFASPIKSYYRDAFASGRALNSHGDRYRTLNLTPLRNGRGTVEFRVFSGSVNPTKITAWVLLCVGIVERALSAAPSVGWDLTDVRSSLARQSPGRTQLEMLMRTLGWTQEASSTRRRFALTAVGGTKGSVMPFVKELRRLARKFDDGNPAVQRQAAQARRDAARIAAATRTAMGGSF